MQGFFFFGVSRKKQPKAGRNDLSSDLYGTNSEKVTDKQSTHCLAVICAKHFHATLR